MSGKGEEDPTWHLMLFVGMLMGLGWLIWHFFRVEILTGIRFVRLAELWIFSLFDSHVHSCFQWLKASKVGMNVPTNEVYLASISCFGANNLRRLPSTEALKYYNVTPESIRYVTSLISPYLRWIAVAICAGLGYVAIFRSPHNKFKTRHSLESFIKLQAKTWPVIAPLMNFNPSESSARIPGQAIPDRLPLFAEALSPEEWISFHRIPLTNGIPDREMTRRAFLQQLGPRWQGIKSLTLPQLGLFVAFALKGAQKREESDEMLGRLALCWTHDKGFNMPEKLRVEILTIAEDPEIGGNALEVANRYAFRTTALLGVLKWARFSGGVLAPGQFVWLRGEDRLLWYPLNNLGRRSFHTEGAGAIAHFMAEDAAQKPLVMPRLDTAIVTLNQYLAANPVKIPPREEPVPKALQAH